MERPLLYTAQVGNEKTTEMNFSRRMSGSALAMALLTIPAERESI